MAPTEVSIHCDGGSRESGKHSSYGCVIKYSGNRIELGQYVPGKTNNQAEYGSLIMALEYIQQLEEDKKVTVFMDSQLVVNQVNGKWKVKKSQLKPLHARAVELCKTMNVSLESVKGEHVLSFNFPDVSLKWVRREFNSEADAVANICMDTMADHYKLTED